MSECALSMLTALADEVNNMDRGRRRELVSATSSQWGDIAGLAQGFIPEQMAAGAASVAQQQHEAASGDARGVQGGGRSTRHDTCKHMCSMRVVYMQLSSGQRGWEALRALSRLGLTVSLI
jgi:hypothetical protein